MTGQVIKLLKQTPGFISVSFPQRLHHLVDQTARMRALMWLLSNMFNQAINIFDSDHFGLFFPSVDSGSSFAFLRSAFSHGFQELRGAHQDHIPQALPGTTAQIDI